MNFHVHQVISRYLVFYVFHKIKIDPPDQLLICNAISCKVKKTSVNIFSLRTFSYYSIMRSDLLDPSSDLPEF